MTAANGIVARIDALQREVDQLWRVKATKESVDNLKEDIAELKGEVRGLRRVLIVTAVSWAGGSGAFLIAVLQLTSG